MSSNYRLVMRTGPNPGQVILLDRTEMIVGRDLNNEIVVNDSEVSRKHARIYVFGQGFVVEDFGSTNGTFVNGQRISGPHSLIPGELVGFGENISYIFEVVNFDPDATRVSVSTPANMSTQTAYTPPPQSFEAPVMPVSSPMQSSASMQYAPPVQATPPIYSGQVPSTVAPVKGKKKSKIWIIFLILFLLLICGCVIVFVVIDSLNLYCDLVPGLMNSFYPNYCQ